MDYRTQADARLSHVVREVNQTAADLAGVAGVRDAALARHLELAEHHAAEARKRVAELGRAVAA